MLQHIRSFVLGFLSLAAALSASAKVIVYDGFPVGSDGYASEADKNPTDRNTNIKNAGIIGFNTAKSWSANNTGVIVTHGSANGLALPTFVSAVAQGTATGTSMGCHNSASTNTSFERIKFRPLTDWTFGVGAVSDLEDKRLHLRLLMRADSAALGVLQNATDTVPVTQNNWYGAGFAYAASEPSGGTHTLLRQNGRTIWFGFVKNKDGAVKVILNVRGHDGTTQTSDIVTLADAQADKTYLCYAEITVVVGGKEQIRAFAIPVDNYSVGNAETALAEATTVEAHLIDAGAQLNYLVVGGAYCTNSGRFSADEIGVATEAQDLIDLKQVSDVYFANAAISGDPVQGVTATATLAHAPDAYAIDCYVGNTVDDLRLVASWSDQTPAMTTWSYDVVDPAWGRDYYAKFVMTSGEKVVVSSVVSCSPSATLTWTGLGTDNRWDTAENWDPVVVPTANLDAGMVSVNATVTQQGSGAAKLFEVSGGSNLELVQGEGNSLSVNAMIVNSGYGNALTVSGGTFTVANDTTFGTGTTAGSNREDPVNGSNGGALTFRDGMFGFGGIRLFGNVYDTVNVFTLTNATVTMGAVETVYNQNAAQGNVRFHAVDSDITTTSHFQLHGQDTSALFERCRVNNNGVIRLGQAANAPNKMRLVDTEWTQTREVILGRKGNQYLEIGSGSVLTVGYTSAASESGHILVGHGSDGNGTGTLVVSNATVNVPRNIYLPQDQRYGSQTMRVHETGDGVTMVNCQNLYVGSTGYNGSKNVRPATSASTLFVDGGTIRCSRNLSVGAVYETAGNTLDIGGATAHCEAGLFALTNASVLKVSIPAEGFVKGPLIDVVDNTATHADAKGTALLSANSSIVIDAQAFARGTVTLLRAKSIESAIPAETIAAAIVPARNATYKVWYECEDDKVVALKVRASSKGFAVIIQ